MEKKRRPFYRRTVYFDVRLDARSARGHLAHHTRGAVGQRDGRVHLRGDAPNGVYLAVCGGVGGQIQPQISRKYSRWRDCFGHAFGRDFIYERHEK